jgi:iron complex outermembrane recepter protein
MENNHRSRTKAVPLSLWVTGLTVLATALMLAGATRSLAGSTNNATPEKTYTFHIASKPLSEALMDFGTVTGFTVLFTQRQPSKLTAPALGGTFTATQALDRLLGGSGYTYRFVDSHTVTLDALPPGSVKNALVLPTLKVQEKNEVPAEIETGGPVKGYVATHDFATEKSGAPILEIPQSISVITQERMQQQDVQTVPQALSYTAGVSSTDYGADSADDYYTVRGFRPSVYQDGIRCIRMECCHFRRSAPIRQNHSGWTGLRCSKDPHQCSTGRTSRVGSLT